MVNVRSRRQYAARKQPTEPWIECTRDRGRQSVATTTRPTSDASAGLSPSVPIRFERDKLGVSLRHLPASGLGANRTWLLASSVALSILAMLSDLAFGPDPDERLPRRRQAKYLRRMLL